jgi:glycine oxidase
MPAQGTRPDPPPEIETEGHLPAEQSYDVVVVGAGVIGLACGWRIAEAGLSVAVVDRAGPGAGASGVAAGMLAPATEADFGGEELLALNLRSAARWPSFDAELAARSARPTGREECGALTVAVDRDDWEELERLLGFQARLGLDARRLTRSECRKLEPGLAPGIAGGILTAGDGAVEPRALMAALTVALDAAGGEVILGLDATLEVAGGRMEGVSTPFADFRAPQVVVATGCWTPDLPGLPPAARPEIRPVKGQILRLRAPRPPASHIVRTPRCYVVPRASGEVVVGATMEERGDLDVTAGAVRELLEAAWEVLPDTAELTLVETGAGLRPATPGNLPVIGRTTVEGLILATGHHRNGVLLAPVTADTVAGLCAGEESPDELAAFSPVRTGLPALEAGR